MRTEICIIESAALEEAELDDHLRHLPDGRGERILSLRQQSARLGAIGGELMLDYGLYEFFGLKSRPEMSRGVHGKPYFADSGIFFNISHSGRYSVCAFGDRELGVDIQEFGGKSEADLFRLAEGAYSAYDRMLMEHSHACAETFYTLWALKESYLKYTGEGLSGGIDTFSFELGDPIRILRIFGEREEDNLLHFHTDLSIDGYVLASCTEVPDVHIRFIDKETIMSRL